MGFSLNNLMLPGLNNFLPVFLIRIGLVHPILHGRDIRCGIACSVHEFRIEVETFSIVVYQYHAVRGLVQNGEEYFSLFL